MNQDATFQKVIIVALLAIIPVGLYYRIRSQATGEPLDRRHEGLLILATLRPVGLVLWFGVLAYMINPVWMAWSSLPLPGWLRWTGAGVGAIAGILLIWTFSTLGPNLTDTVVTRRAHTLVTRGPYRSVRHPFYDSAALLLLAITLMAANWFFLLGGAVFLFLIVLRTRTEEEKLQARFGDAYLAYKLRTGRFVPRGRRE